MPAAIPAGIGAAASIYGGIKASKDAKKAQKATAQKTVDDRAYRENTLNRLLQGGGQGTGFSGGGQSPYNHNYNPSSGGSEQPDVHENAQGGGRRPGPYAGSYFQEGDPEGMFQNEGGGHDWVAGTGPQWLKNSAQYGHTGQRPVGRRPPTPDEVAERGTPDWNNAYNKEQGWIKQNLDSGRTLRDLGLDPTRGGGMSNYMKWGDYKADPNAAPPPGDRYNLPPGENGEGGGRRYDIPPGENGPGGEGGGGYSGMYDYAGPDDVYGNSETGGDYGLANFYQRTLGNSAQSSAVLAPQTQALQEQKDGQIKNIMATIPPGGQRDRALSQLDKSFSSSLGQLRQGLISSSLGGLQSLYGTQLGDATNRYGIDTSAATSRYATDAQRAAAEGNLGLGYANLGQQGYQFDTGLDWQKNQFGQNFGLEKAKYLSGNDQWDQQFQRQDDYRNQDATNARWAGVGNTLSGLAGAYLDSRSGKSGQQQNRVNMIPSTKYSFTKPARY